MKIRQSRGKRVRSQLHNHNNLVSSLTEKNEDMEFIRDLPPKHPITLTAITFLDNMIESECKIREITAEWEQTPDSYAAILLHPLQMAISVLLYHKQLKEYQSQKRKFHCADIGLTALSILAEDAERGRTPDECREEIVPLLANNGEILSGLSSKYEVGRHFLYSQEFLELNETLMEVAQSAVDFAG